ncbi:trypsin-like peptidase domain-containing protein [Verrucomicrobiota bacterium]
MIGISGKRRALDNGFAKQDSSRKPDGNGFLLVWVVSLSAIVVVMATAANLNMGKGKLKTEMGEHWRGSSPGNAEQSATGPRAGSPANSEAVALEQTFNAIARSMNRVAVGIAGRRVQNGIPCQVVGSGVIIAPQHVLSNLHVVDNAQSLTVTVYDPQKAGYPARVLWRDQANDLAILEIQATRSFPFARLGNSDLVDAGDIVFAIGNPLGFGNTITSGIISDRNETFTAGGQTFRGMLQTNTDIHQGSSGGPLVNIAGEVIGINSAVYAPRGNFTGIGFATPINRASALLQQGNLKVAKNAQLPAPCPVNPAAAGCPPNCTLAVGGCPMTSLPAGRAPNCIPAAGTPIAPNAAMPAVQPRSCPNCNALLYIRCRGCRRRMIPTPTGQSWMCPSGCQAGPSYYVCPYCPTPRNQDNNNPFRVAA